MMDTRERWKRTRKRGRSHFARSTALQVGIPVAFVVALVSCFRHQGLSLSCLGSWDFYLPLALGLVLFPVGMYVAGIVLWHLSFSGKENDS